MPLPSFGRPSSRTNAKGATNRRRRGPDAQDASAVADDHELTNYLAALAPETDQESTGSGRRFGDAQVYQLRVNNIVGQQLKDLAVERGTSPQALAQEWILERLSQEAQGIQGGFEQPRGAADPADTDQLFLDRQRWEQPVRGSLG